MNILVTGGTGFIGKRLCEVLARRGHQLTVLSRDAKRAETVLPQGTRVVTSLDNVANDEQIVLGELAVRGIECSKRVIKRYRLCLVVPAARHWLARFIAAI